MDKEIIISIIMPVYNAENTLSKAINSVLHQVFNEFELILVNDGSKDNSLKICREFEEKDKRVKVISQSNLGICGARNTGLNHALGKYIAFIDNDDIYDENLLKDNYVLLMQYDADMIKFYSCESNNRIETNNKNVFRKETTIKNDIKKDKYVDMVHDHLMVFTWDMIIKRSLIENNKIYFDTYFKHGHEDILFSNQCYWSASKIIVNPKVYYIHTSSNTSVSRKFFSEQIEATAYLLQKENVLLHENGIDNEIWKEIIEIRYIYIWQYLSHQSSKMSFSYMRMLFSNFSQDNGSCSMVGAGRTGIKKYIILILDYFYNKKMFSVLIVNILIKKIIVKMIFNIRSLLGGMV